MKPILPYILLIIVLLIAGGVYLQTTSNNSGSKSDLSLLNIKNGLKNKTGVEFSDYGKAPEFAGIYKWLNSEPLSQKALLGKVVLIDFWTFSCINCIRTLPYVTKWYDTYKDKGLVVVGVHTPEFAFEKDTQNVQDAIRRFKINYPVAQDNDFATWKAYANSYWPAEYLIDQNGNIVYTHFGEGNYDRTENAIRQLLGLDMVAKTDSSANLSKILSPEMYLGNRRLEHLSPSQTPTLETQNYVFPAKLELNEFAVSGKWSFKPEHMTCEQPVCKLKLKFYAGKVHMVASAPLPAKLKITVDNKIQPSVEVMESKLYTIFDSSDYTEHELLIEFPKTSASPNAHGNYFQMFTFTFG